MSRIKYNKEQLKEFIDKFIKEHGRVPERRDFLGNPNYPSSSQYVREWGSWGQAMIALKYRDSKKEKKKLKSCKCLECNKDFKAYQDRKYCSITCRDNYNRKKPKEVKAKLSRENYRAIAFRSYEWKCQICGTVEDTEYLYGKSSTILFPTILDVHHIDSNRDNNDFRNLCILCPTCHAKVHRGIYTNLKRGTKFLTLSWDKVSLTEYNKSKKIRRA